MKRQAEIKKSLQISTQREAKRTKMRVWKHIGLNKSVGHVGRSSNTLVQHVSSTRTNIFEPTCSNRRVRTDVFEPFTDVFEPTCARHVFLAQAGGEKSCRYKRSRKHLYWERSNFVMTKVCQILSLQREITFWQLLNGAVVKGTIHLFYLLCQKMP